MIDFSESIILSLTVIFELKDNYTLQYQYRYLWYKETRLFVISIQTWITDFRIQEEPESMEVTVSGE